MTYDLICLGNLTIDDIVLPDHTVRKDCFGGDAIYAALGASFWSDSVALVAPIGNDFPSQYLDLLPEHGLETRGMPKRSIPGIRNWVRYQDGNIRSWELQSNPDDFLELSPRMEDIPPNYLDALGFLLLAMDLKAQETLAPQLRIYGLVAVDLQEDYIAGNEQRILEMVKYTDVFLPSHEEVFRLMGHRDYQLACRQFAEHGARIVCIKLGSSGSLVYERTRDQFWKIPVYPTKVVDTTGAGDAYCGGFLAMYLQTGDLLKAGIAGAVSASFAVEDFGLSHMFSVTRQQALARMIELEATFDFQWRR